MAERERIARDLHDVLGHTLSVISLKSQLAVRLTDRDPARAAAEIAEVEAIARTALTELRETVSGYRSAGLPAEVDRARFVLASAGVAVECEVADVPLGAIEENVLALALREAVTNVVRHAHAGACRVSIAAAERSCILEIADDGARPSGAEGAGLRGMRERVEAVGGTVARDLTAGTHLRISVPLARDRA
jgi:two-component system sensor histidine kinase DesK